MFFFPNINSTIFAVFREILPNFQYQNTFFQKIKTLLTNLFNSHPIFEEISLSHRCLIPHHNISTLRIYF
jgi:hypothetical protein